MENDMEAGLYRGCIVIHVYKEYLHWVFKSVDLTYMGLFGSQGSVRGYMI